MSQLYARVFVKILDSSIAEDYTMRHVFEDFLKLADHRTGIVDITRQALSRKLNIPLDVLNAEISKLEAPDPASRDPEHEGRRLARLDPHRDWGWQILNWSKYEDIKSKADVAARVARHREQKKKTQKLNPEPKSTYHPDARSVLHLLNQHTGRSFRELDSNLTPISARLSEPGVDLEGVRKMIGRQCKRWIGTKFEQYLQPSTLFAKTKFDEYYASRDLPVQNETDTRSSQPSNPRNAGCVPNTTDYKAAAKARGVGGKVAAPELPLSGAENPATGGH